MCICKTVTFVIFSCINSKLSDYFIHSLQQSMSSDAPQEQQTIEFYKIQIMQKDREIADFTAKMKKVQFKHNRQLKELKISKQRFEGLLKEEKTKSDRYNKLAQENIQQNQILELRLCELKKEKERELTDIQTKYNALKEEVRSYERILPTFTFLCEIGQTIGELPNYEDLFVNLREKEAECKELQQALSKAKDEWEELMRTIKANEEVLNNKKVEAEKNLKEIVSKLMQNEHLISDLKIQNDDLMNTRSLLQEELELTQERCQSLEDSIKDYEAKIEHLVEQFENQLINKEQEVTRAHQGELIQLEDQLRNLQAALQRKQSMFNEQVRLLQEEIAFLNNKYQTEIQTFQEHYLCIKEETERMRNQITNQKQRYDDLQERFDDSVNNLIKISTVHEQVQLKNKTLQHKLDQYQHQMAREFQKYNENDRNRCEELQIENEELQERLNEAAQHVHQLQEERDRLQEENFILREEISNKSFEKSDSKSFFLDISKSIVTQQERIRKKSAEVQKTIIEKYQKFQDHTLNIPKSRRGSMYEDARITDLQKQIALLEKKGEIEGTKLIEIENRCKLLQSENQRIRHEGQNYRKEREKMISEGIALKEKIVYLTKASNDHQKAMYGNTTKNSLQKTKIQALQEENKYLKEDNKRQKQAIKRLKEEIKSAKEQHTSEFDRLNKETKESNVQIESLKGQKEKLRHQIASRQKIWSNESALLKSNKEHEERLKEQIRQLKLQKQAEESINMQLKGKYAKFNSEIAILHKQIERLELSLKQSIRQNQLINQSLERERKQRSLLTVPSLHSISGEQSQEETFNQIYAKIPQKQGEISLLQRQILDCREEIETLRITHHAKMEAMQLQSNDYVQTIIEMKMRCAQAEMRASQKEYLYMQLKKKAVAMNVILK